MITTISALTKLFSDESIGDTYREAFCYALAIRLAGTIPMVEKQQEDITLTFLDGTVLPFVKEALSDINENLVFDTACTLDCIRAIFTYRYYSAYPKVQLQITQAQCLTAAAYSPTNGLNYANQAFAKMNEMNEFLQNYPTEVNAVYSLVTRLLQKVSD